MVTHPMKQGTFQVSSGYGPRWGTFHAGLDFAAPIGTPIYAAADGVVVEGKDRHGVAGFGSWIWLDCQASVGKDFIYGHVKYSGILVKKGDRVKAGQQIGVVGNEGQSTGPHLHFEVWGSPGRLGGAHQDPAPYLKNALWPGNSVSPKSPAKAPAKSKDGLLFGLDVSSWQDGLHLGGVPDIDFVIARTTDGTYRDRAYRSHIDDAERAGLVTAAYHYLRAPSEGAPIAQQVSASLEVMGPRHKRPVWIDVETSGGTLTAANILDCKRLFEQAGVRVVGVYSYIPYWEGRIAGGEPDTHQFGSVWVANYPDSRRVPFKELWNRIPKDKFDYPLGNQKPKLWQYSGNAAVPGWGSGVDANAFRGTKDELHRLFYGGTKTNDFTEEEMKQIDNIERATTGKRRSLINPEVELTPAQMISCIDAATWQNRAIITAIADKLGLDVDQIVGDAIAEDRAKN